MASISADALPSDRYRGCPQLSRGQWHLEAEVRGQVGSGVLHRTLVLEDEGRSG